MRSLEIASCTIDFIIFYIHLKPGAHILELTVTLASIYIYVNSFFYTQTSLPLYHKFTIELIQRFKGSFTTNM